jgi:hypothetical protein
MLQGRRSAASSRSLRALLLVLASVTIAVLALRNWGLVLCAWGSMQSCQAWALQTGYASLFGVLPVRQLPTLPLTLVGPLGYLLATSIWRRKHLLAKGTA